MVNNDNDFSQYIGECVTVNGKLADGWERLEENNYEINGRWTFNRSAIIVHEINKEDISLCASDYDRTVKDQAIIESSRRESVKGILEFAKRPAPDIDYDFVLRTDDPLVGEQNAVGYLVEINKLNIDPGTDEILALFIENIGKEVEVHGYMVWEYSESRILVVDSM